MMQCGWIKVFLEGTMSWLMYLTYLPILRFRILHKQAKSLHPRDKVTEQNQDSLDGSKDL